MKCIILFSYSFTHSSRHITTALQNETTQNDNHTSLACTWFIEYKLPFVYLKFLIKHNNITLHYKIILYTFYIRAHNYIIFITKYL